MDPLDIIAKLAEDYTGPAPTDAELEQAAKDIREALDVATKADEPELDLAKDLAEALQVVTKAADDREAAREERRAEAKKLREGIFDDEPETPAEETPAVETPVEAEVNEPVAASSIIERLKRHAATKAPEQEKPKTMGGVRTLAVGPAAGYDVGEGTFADLGKLFATHAKSVQGIGKSDRLFRLNRDFDESRKLGYNVEVNNRRITDVFGYGQTSRPVAAAGGLCGPGEVDFSHPICADRGRPVRDSLVQFNAARGQVTYSPAAGLGDVDGAVSIWTPAMDAAAPASGVKPCPPVECPEELTAAVDAVTRCLTIGNFQATFSPELWASRLELLLALHDRIAEQKSLVEIHEGSTFIAAGSLVDGGNVIANFLENINIIVAQDRAIQRNLTGQYVALTDSYVRDAIRNQVIQNLGVANNVETIQIADAIIAGWLADVNVRPVWTVDGTVDEQTGDHNIPTAVGAPLANATVYVYPEDAWMFLDGGTLDLGTQITDSSLNSTNDRQAFAETFEKTAFRGCSSYAFELDTTTSCGCPVAP